MKAGPCQRAAAAASTDASAIASSRRLATCDTLQRGRAAAARRHLGSRARDVYRTARLAAASAESSSRGSRSPSPSTRSASHAAASPSSPSGVRGVASHHHHHHHRPSLELKALSGAAAAAGADTASASSPGGAVGRALGLDELAAAGASLLPVHEPHALLRPSSRWNLSGQIRQAIEDAIRTGVNVALVRFPGMSAPPTTVARAVSVAPPAAAAATTTSSSSAVSLVAAQASPMPAVPAALPPPHAAASPLAPPTPTAPPADAGIAADAALTGEPPSLVVRYQADGKQYLLLVQQPGGGGGSSGATIADRADGSSSVDAAALRARSEMHAAATTSAAAAASSRRISSSGASSSSSLSAAAAAAPAPPTSASNTAAALHPSVITGLLCGCQDAASVQALVEAHWETLDAIHVGAAFVQLARIASRRRSSSSSSSSSTDSSATAAAASHSSHAAAGAELRAATREASFLRSLLLLAESHLARMQSRQVTNVLWAAATLRLNPGDAWLERFASRAAALLARGTAPQGFANTLWALATLRYAPPPHWYAAFYAASRPHLRAFKDAELSSALWALATLRTARPPRPWLDAVFDASAARMGGCGAQALSNTAWALASLRVAPTAAWLAAARYAAQRLAPEFTPLGLSNALWGLAVLSGRAAARDAAAACDGGGDSGSSAPWLLALEAAAARRLSEQQRYPPHHLANALWALAALGRRPDASFMVAWQAAAAPQLGAFSARALASSLRAMARAGWAPPRTVLGDMLAAAMAAGLDACPPRALADAASASARLLALVGARGGSDSSSDAGAYVSAADITAASAAVAPPPGWRAAMLAASLPQLHACSASELIELGAALAALPGDVADDCVSSAAASAEWVAAYEAAALARLPTFGGGVGDFCALLRVLAAWRARDNSGALLPPPSEGWSAVFAAAACQALHGEPPAAAARLLRALARADVVPDERQMAALLEHLLPVSPAAAVVEAEATAAPPQQQYGRRGAYGSVNGSAVGSFVRVRGAAADAPPPPPVNAAAAPGVAADDLASHVAAWQGLAGLGFRPALMWQQRYFARAAPLLRAARAGELADLLTALAELRVRPPTAWAAALFARAAGAAAEGELGAQQVARLLWAAAALRRGNAVRRAELDALLAAAAAAPAALAELPLCEFAPAVWGAASMGAFDAAAAASADDAAADGPPSAADAWWAHLTSDAVAAELAAAPPGDVLHLARAIATAQRAPPPQWSAAFFTSADATLAAADDGSLNAADAHDARVLAVVLLRLLPLLGGAPAHPALAARALLCVEAAAPLLAPEHLVRALSASAAARAAPGPRWLGALADAAEARLPEFNSEQVGALLVALAAHRASPSAALLDAALERAADAMRAAPAAALVDAAWGAAALGARPRRTWWRALEARVSTIGAERLTSEQLPRLLWALAAAQHRPTPQLRRELVAVAGAKAGTMSPSSLADTLWAVAALREAPGAEWLDGVLCRARALLAAGAFDPRPQALVELLWGLALLRHRPRADWLALALGAARGALDGGALSGAQVAKLLWALAALDCKPDAALLAAGTAAACERLAAGMGSASVAEVVWALGRLDDSRERRWLAAFNDEARARLVAPARPLPPLLSTGGVGADT